MPQFTAERLLCDTSFVGHSAKRTVAPERFSHWPQTTIDRIDQAILAISVITLAEARAGFLTANWGPPRIAREENRLASFLYVPLDMAILNEWARLQALNKSQAWNISHNDLWIAATATERGFPLVTCDSDFNRMSDPRLSVLYLPPPT